MQSVYLGIDLGTQSVRVMAVTVKGDVVASASRPLISKRNNVRHEQDPEQWWSASVQALREVVVQCGQDYEVLGLAVDATSGTILLVDDRDRPITAGIMYDDARASDEVAEVNEKGSALWQQLSYRIQPSWALPKLLWLLRHGYAVQGARLFHQNDWLNMRLAGRQLSSDSSNALKTGYDLLRSSWPHDIFDALGIPQFLLPEIVSPGECIGYVGSVAAATTGLRPGTPIIAGMTDGCAAQIASGATSIGSWNTVVGTTLVVKGVTRHLLRDPLGAVYSHRSMNDAWLPGGASSTGAGAIAAGFAAEDLPRLNQYAEANGPTNLVVYPLEGIGERFPFAASEARGFTLGAERSREDRYIGVLQGIALWERLCFDALRSLAAPTGGSLYISGGATKSRALNQFRADAMQRELHLAAVTEGAFGMAVLASAATSSMEEATMRMVRRGAVVEPRRPFADYSEQYARLLNELHRRGWLPDSLLAAAQREMHT